MKLNCSECGHDVAQTCHLQSLLSTLNCTQCNELMGVKNVIFTHQFYFILSVLHLSLSKESYCMNNSNLLHIGIIVVNLRVEYGIVHYLSHFKYVMQSDPPVGHESDCSP